MIKWFSNAWSKFETWVASWAPGFKTEFVAFLGILGNAAYLGQQYVQGLPAVPFANATVVATASVILFTLAFWLRGIGERTATSTGLAQLP